MVSSINGDDFTLHTDGYTDVLSSLTAGDVYFLSESTSGLMTITEPGAANISKPLMTAISTTSGYFKNYRGILAAGGAGTSGTSGSSGTSGVGADGSSGTSGVGASGSSGTSGSSGAAGAGSNIRLFAWTITNPVAAQVIPGPRLREAHTATRVDAYVTAATNCIFNIEERDSATPNTAGTDIMTSDLTAITTGASTTTINNPALAADNWLSVVITSISGTPGVLQVTLATTV